MRQNRSRGFTLLEIMLVLLLVGVVLAMAGLQVGQGPHRLARQEAALFLQLVQYARQQAGPGGAGFGCARRPPRLSASEG
ncbi:prepilin-type N-terminal cleavage/methylation domain-containing protein [Pseudomonas sp. PhalM4]